MEDKDNTTAGLWLGATLLALGVGIFLSGTAPTAPDPANHTESAARPETIQRFRVPVTSTQPSAGPREALVTIVEWCGLRGQACRESDEAIRAILSEYPNDIRRVYRHLPTRQSVPSQLLHHVAHGVHFHAGKFWEFRALALAVDDAAELGLAELQAMAEQVHADWKPIEHGLGRMGYAQHVNADLTFAGRFGVDAAPGLFVNGRRLQVTHPSPSRASQAPSLTDALRSLVREELAIAQTFVARGVKLTELYDELTRDAQWTATQQLSAAEPMSTQPALQTATR